MDTLRKRLEALTPDQRSLLMQRLEQTDNNRPGAASSSGQRLVAYVVPRSDTNPTSDEIQRFLKNRLPEYMAPTLSVFMDALPRTPNGKVDRRALPEPDLTQTEHPDGPAGPRNDIETLLVDIWADVLGFEEVGIHDNFFEMGGDSILSIQIVARAHQAGIQLTPQQLLQHTTIAELAIIAEQSQDTPPEQDAKAGDTGQTSEQAYTSSDFPEAGLDQDELDQFLKRITED